MGTAKEYHFGSFRLDSANEQLWHRNNEIRLRPKTFEVLRYLVEHASKLVTKAALFDALWPQVVISDSVPSICVAELRKALGDDLSTPRFIETVHGRGYRFIAPVTIKSTPDTAFSMASVPPTPAPIMVGREAQLRQMSGWFADVRQGHRRIVFVTGEPGIGKTTFVRAFLHSIAEHFLARIGYGQCIEQYGVGEPYMPMLEALTRLAEEADRDRVLEIIKRFAPTWLVQMPSLLTGSEREGTPGGARSASQQRMLREMTHALEALSTDLPLVLLFEDLHWSDFSTIALISAIARRTEPARLLVIGTYRPVDVLTSAHPLRTFKQELQVHRLCEELRLQSLGPESIAEYLQRRFSSRPDKQWYAALTQGIHERTEGNPLFVTNLVDNLIAQGVLHSSGFVESTGVIPMLDASRGEMPITIVQMIECNIDQLGLDEQRVLEVASVAGAAFSAAAVAAALESPQSEIESRCNRMSRHQNFVQANDIIEWPDHTVAETFHFRHALYREALYDRIPVSRRIELHRRIAEREEIGYGDHVAEIATELAHHYSRANDANKAIHYLQIAGERAYARSAMTEAERHFGAALELLHKALPESHERDNRELWLRQSALSMLSAIKGYAHPETIEAVEQSIALAERSGNVAQLFRWLTARGSILFLSGQLRIADATLDQALALASRHGVQDGGRTHRVQILTRYWQGDFIGSETHLAAWLSSFGDPMACDPRAINDAVNALAFASFNAWVLGRADLAYERKSQMIAAANRGGPFEIANAKYCASRLELYLKQYERARVLCADALTIAEKHQLPDAIQRARCGLGAALAYLGRPSEGVTMIRQVIEEWLENGQRHAISTWMTYLADAQQLAGAVKDALETFQCALEVHPDEVATRPETIRLYAELRLKMGQLASAETGFREAISLACRIGAKAWELRATISLARLLAGQGRRREADEMLAKVYSSFTEGFDTADLKEAMALLDESNEQPIAPIHLNGSSSNKHPRTV